MIITPLLVIFLVIVFALTLIFIRTIDKRHWVSIPVSILLTPVLYFFAFYPLLNIFSSYHHQKYFNTEVWLDDPGFRYEMYNDLEKSDTLMGSSKQKVQQLLGKYEWLSWDDAVKNHDPDKWNYGLGILPGAFNDQSEALEIIFKNNSVSDIRTYQQELEFDDKK